MCVGCENLHTIPCSRVFMTFWHLVHTCALKRCWQNCWETLRRTCGWFSVQTLSTTPLSLPMQVLSIFMLHVVYRYISIERWGLWARDLLCKHSRWPRSYYQCRCFLERRDLCADSLVDKTFAIILQPIAFGVSLNLNLQYQSPWSLFIGTWQKRTREQDDRLRFEFEEMTLQMQ